MKTLVVIGTIFPESSSSAAGVRMRQLIDFFKWSKYTIHFLSTSPIGTQSDNLPDAGIKIHIIELNSNSVEDLLCAINPEIVLFDRFISEEQFGWRVASAVPEALRILDTEDLHFLRAARKTALQKQLPVSRELLQNEIAKREIASILRCDVSLIISSYEFKLLTNVFSLDQTILFYMPLLAQPSPTNNSFSQRVDFLSVGNFRHDPNWQTVLKLNALWPKIRAQLPGANLHVFGAYPPEKAMNLNNATKGFLVHGHAQNLEKVYATARVLLAPIPYGAGLKGKLIDSMKYGVPNVTTSVGAEGLDQAGIWNGFITDDELDFVRKAITLYENENLWNTSRLNGFAIIEKALNVREFYPKLHDLIYKILLDLHAHRQKNFLGQILSHHTLQSTKYLSRWIEAKNKK
ncbi:glycosyltransferase [Planobacterium oryzisoli]|uniref:Glycosyltransferase family 4 protein n=1 Tax=Planobacterium oryzisoli TaxID=2771435 RepID=A0A930YUQ6_9FLAO|nr:glycosyltransferase family 4 protein [Planobacterium oryzisoli]MBF5026719.1 glycosyltransferase family 4 protein [Planobacterium oryzisoli]